MKQYLKIKTEYILQLTGHRNRVSELTERTHRTHKIIQTKRETERERARQKYIHIYEQNLDVTRGYALKKLWDMYSYNTRKKREKEMGEKIYIPGNSRQDCSRSGKTSD